MKTQNWKPKPWPPNTIFSSFFDILKLFYGMACITILILGFLGLILGIPLFLLSLLFGTGWISSNILGMVFVAMICIWTMK